MIGMIKRWFSKTEHPPVTDGKVGQYVVVTTSVYAPVICEGDLVLIRKVCPRGEKIYLGDGMWTNSVSEGYMVEVNSAYRKDFLHGIFVETTDIRR